MMRYWGVVFCFCLWGWGVQGQPEVALKQLLETPGLNHAAIGISVKKVGDGTTVLAHQAGMAHRNRTGLPRRRNESVPWILRRLRGGDFHGFRNVPPDRQAQQPEPEYNRSETGISGGAPTLSRMNRL